MNDQELNRKLAEWAGFSVNTCDYDWKEGQRWYTPEHGTCKDIPDFIHSLDACFKWLWPNLEWVQLSGQVYLNCDLACSSHIRSFAGKPTKQTVGGTEKSTSAKTPTLALCLAIEKLIDSQGDHVNGGQK